MANKKISELASGTPGTSSVLPASDAAGTVTNKVTVQSILDLDSRWNVFKPGQPTINSVTAGDAQATLAYSTTGTLLSQTPLTDFLIQYSTDGGTTWTTYVHAPSTLTTVLLTGLTNGTTYTFRVAAVNAVGASPYSSASAAVTPVTVPGSPSGLTGSAGNAQVALSWTAPSSNGGSALTDYVIEYSADSGTTWNTFADGTNAATSATVTGLTNGAAYVFRVSAVTAVGIGSPSAASSTITPTTYTVPDSPTSFTAASGNAQLSLSWTAPSSDGGSAINNYSIQYTPSGGSTATVITGSTSTSYTLTGLTNGTAYTVAVAAVNGVGTGGYTSTISGTPATVPGTPTSVAGGAGDALAALTWTAPANNGGSPITGYVVEYTPAGASAVTVSTGSTLAAYSLTGLTNGTTYTVRVAAINAKGTGAYSSSTSVTPSAVPALQLTKAAGKTWTGTGTAASPYAFAGNMTDEEAATGANRLTFTATQRGVFYFSTVYVDAADDNASGVLIQKNGVTVYNPGMINGATQTFSTSVVTNVGDVFTFLTNRSYPTIGTYTNTSVYLAPYPLISDPSAVTGTSGNGSVALSWTAPTTNANVITDYVVEYSFNGGVSWATWAHTAFNTNSTTVTELWNGVSYLFRVKAIGTQANYSNYATTVASVLPSGTANASAANDYIITNYSSGAWSGTTPIASSSTFGPVNGSVLPFVIAAKQATEVTIAYRHQNATANDNHGIQSVYFRVNGVLPYYSQTQTAASADTSFKVQLSPGDLLQMYVSGSASYDNPTDTYTNISITATAPSATKLLLLSTGSTGTWTGTGTATDKFTAPTPLAQGKLANYNLMFIAMAPCTFNASAAVAAIPDDNGQALQLKVNMSADPVQIGEGVTGSMSYAVQRGQLLVLWQNSGGSQVSNLQVWST